MWCNDSCGGSPPPPVKHSLTEVTETAALLSQLQLGSTAPEPREQYAIIDTNQLLEHLDAVNSMLEHVVAWILIGN